MPLFLTTRRTIITPAAQLMAIGVLIWQSPPSYAQTADQSRDNASAAAEQAYLARQQSRRSADASPASRTADTSNGRAGQRQTRDTTAGIAPLKRLDTRVANRVQTRLRTRIDRYYEPQANATSPFKVAGEATRRQGQARR